MAGVIAVGLMIIAYGLVPIAVAQTIFGAGTLLIIVAARQYLREPVRDREYFGLGVIVVSVILVSATLTSSSRLDAGGSTVHVLLVSAVTTVFSGLVFGVLGRSSVDRSVPFGLASGLLYGVAALQAKAASTIVNHDGVLASIPRIFASPDPYLFVVMSGLGLVIFQMGLQRCRVAVLVPITNTIASVYVVAAGMLVFDESLPLNAVPAILRVVGFALVLVASWVLGSGATIAVPIGELKQHQRPERKIEG
jgi:multidrug transporter EmrE-like cation transporter